MPVGYMIGTVLVAWVVLMALVAPRRPRLLARMSFILGLSVNELPFLVIALLLTSAVLLFAQGDAGSPGAWVALGLAALTVVALVIILVRAVRARPVVGDALDEGLGAGWQRNLDERARERWRQRLPYARLLIAPLSARRRGVERIANLRYGPDPRRHLLDVYRSRSAAPDAPMLVYFHGGGYFSGRKNWEARPLLYRFASQGWVCIGANYRLRPRAGFPEHLADAKKTIAWAREHAAEYGADPAAVYAAGSSAGAHLVSICALTPSEPALQPDLADADTSIRAAICLYGYYGYYYGMRPADRPVSSPLGYPVPDTAPPFFVAHGDQDTYTPVEGARELVTHLRASSTNPVVYAELPGAQHAFDLFRSVRFEAVINGIDVFTSWVHAREHPADTPPNVS